MADGGDLGPLFANWPREQIRYNPEIWPVLESAIRGSTRMIRAALYTVDNFIVGALSAPLRRASPGEPFTLRLVLDKNQATSPSCSTQRAARSVPQCLRSKSGARAFASAGRPPV